MARPRMTLFQAHDRCMRACPNSRGAMTQPSDLTSPDALALLARIASALEKLAPAPAKAPDFGAADAFVWHASPPGFAPVRGYS